ncbi:MAG TPA: hemolysin family protein [Cryomorphaceae bacterium]|nr:hemolysin family protein [Cryomorphaceae bacterium]
MEISDAIIILVSVVFSAFFSGMEIAFITANKLKIELDNKQGQFSAKLLSGFLQRPSKFIGTMLVGNNIALVLFGIFMAKWLEPVFIQWGLSEVSVLLLQTIVSTLIILFAGEFVPKTLFRINSNFLLNLFAFPLAVLYFLLWIPMMVTVGLAELVLKYIFRVDIASQEVAFGRIDLDNYVKEITEAAEKTDEEIDHEIQIFQNALDFSKIKARDCMVPRTEISAVDVEDDLDKLRDMFIENGYSKVPVYRDSIDNIIGYVNAVELFNKPENIKNLIVPVIIIPETISAKEVLELFISQNKNIAVVVDEFGGTSGMLTIEDVIEEIFGDIEDEHDRDEFIEEKIDENTYLFSARLEIDYLNDTYKFNLPENEEYETLAGLIIHSQEEIPKVNSVTEIEGFRFRVTAVSNVRIETVKLQIIGHD